VDLSQTQQLQDLPCLGVQGVDPTDADRKDQLWFGLHVEGALLLGLPFHLDQIQFLHTQIATS
jgi:hypothetical protein